MKGRGLLGQMLIASVAGLGIASLAIMATVPIPQVQMGNASQVSVGTPKLTLDDAANNGSVRSSLPIRIRIQSIDVHARIMPLGLQRDGTLQVPPNSYLTGWFTGGPRPGEVGPSVIVGHVHWDGRWGVFRYLAKMRLGDIIEVTRADGSSARFRVNRVSHFKKSHFPTQLVYGNVDSPELRLVTCYGFNSGARAYLENVVVFAQAETLHENQRIQG